MKRKTVLAVGGIYHIFNRGIDKRDIFLDPSYYSRFVSTLEHSLKYNYPYSLLKRRLKEAESSEDRKNILLQLETKRIEPPVEVLSFCLMPNHFHLTLKQLVEDGITELIRRICTAYTMYFNVRQERRGSLFGGVFRSVLVETEEQLIHLSRYQHLNPLKAGITEIPKLGDYPWSSLPTYLGRDDIPFVNSRPVMSHFKDAEGYLRFLEAETDEYEPLRLEGIAIDDDFGWFACFRDYEEERKEALRKRYMELL